VKHADWPGLDKFSALRVCQVGMLDAAGLNSSAANGGLVFFSISDGSAARTAP